MNLSGVSLILIPIVAIIFGIALAGWAIYWDHKKKMALIEKGLYSQEEHAKPKNPAQQVLGWGLVLTGFGIALLIGFFWGGTPDVALPGLIFGFIGVALLIFFAVIRKRTTP